MFGLDDERILRLRDGLFLSLSLLIILVMWGGLWGLPLWTSVIVYILVALNAMAILHIVRLTGLDAVATSPLPIATVIAMVLCSLVRMFWAIMYGD